MKNDNRGFSLLELLIVVAIILVIATIAIPSLLKSRQVANETLAIASLKALNTAQVQYSSSLSAGFGSLPDLIAAGLLDNSFTSKGGYDLVVMLSANTLDYTATATARTSNDGRFDYYTRPDYVIRYSTDVTRAPIGLSGEPVR